MYIHALIKYKPCFISKALDADAKKKVQTMESKWIKKTATKNTVQHTVQITEKINPNLIYAFWDSHKSYSLKIHSSPWFKNT